MSSLRTTSVFLDRKDYEAAKRLGRKSKSSAGAVIRIALAAYLARESKKAKRQVVAA
jgi:hypothetical protein